MAECGRHYSIAQQRAQEVLQHDVMSNEDILYVLSALPQPKNTRRVGVIPEGQAFVHSQAAGLTTQHGLNSLSLILPFVLALSLSLSLSLSHTHTLSLRGTTNYVFYMFKVSIAHHGLVQVCS